MKTNGLTVGDVIKELSKFPRDLKVTFEYSFFDCGGHGDDEYCYCSDTTVREDIHNVDLIKLDVDGKKLKTEEIVLTSND